MRLSPPHPVQRLGPCLDPALGELRVGDLFAHLA